MIKSKIALSGALLILSTPSFAQMSAVTPAPTPAPAPAPSVMPQAAAVTQIVLRAQTPVILRMSEELTTKKKKLRVGHRFNLEVAEPVMLEGSTVIPAGAPATGEITEVRNKGMWGKSGYIGAQLVQLRVGDRTIRLSGSFDDKGVTGTGGVVAAIALLPIAGFFTTGTSAVIPMGAQIKGYIGEDVQMNVAAAPAAAVAAPASPSAVLPVAAPASSVTK